jgi:response regulator RpfG family c-di-GMP phosphodiesterase
MMPGMDGWAVLTALKSDPATADIPVIVVSMIDDKNLGYSLGAAEYVTKPIDRERFSRVLDRTVAVAATVRCSSSTTTKLYDKRCDLYWSGMDGVSPRLRTARSRSSVWKRRRQS